jgi:DNA repair exonuclease SbcCD ATPase subunit
VRRIRLFHPITGGARYPSRSFAVRNKELEEALAQLESEKSELQETIRGLSELSEIAADVAQLREKIESCKATQQRELERLDESFEEAEFEKNKKINQIRRDQE